MRRRNLGRYPAMAASAALHLALLATVLIILPRLTKPLTGSTVVPVTLVTSVDIPDLAAITPVPKQAPTPMETPEPQTPPVQPSSSPAPQSIAPKPMPKVPTKAPTNTASSDDNFLKNLAASLPHSSPPRKPTPPTTPSGGGAPVSANARAVIEEALRRVWNANCDVPAGAQTNIEVTFQLDSSGRLVGEIHSAAENSSDPIVRTAFERAVRAINQAKPFPRLPLGFPGGSVTAPFDAKQACAQQ